MKDRPCQSTTAAEHSLAHSTETQHSVLCTSDEKVKSNGHHLPQPEPYSQSASIRLTKQSKTPMVARDHEISPSSTNVTSSIRSQGLRLSLVVVVHPVSD
jgi:hypothetical protein